MASLKNQFVAVLFVIGGVSLALPQTVFARGGHGGSGSHVVTHRSAPQSRSRSQNVVNTNRNNAKSVTGSRQASASSEKLHVQPDDLGNDLLNDLNTTLNTLTGDPSGGGSFGSSGPGGSTPEENGPNSLTNGSGGQYQDGSPPNNPPAGAGGTTSSNSNAGSAAGSAMGASAGLTGSNTPAPISPAQLVKNKKNLVGKVPAGWGNRRNKVPDPGAPSTTPSTSTTPTNPTTPTTPPAPAPVPVPYPVGPVFGGTSTVDMTPTSTTVDPAPAATDAPATDVPTTAAAADSAAIDLVVEDVQQVSPATLVAGPAYKVTFRNQGSEQAGRFQVGIFAGLDRKLSKQAPRAIVEVASLAAGEAKTVTLRLPQRAMRMIEPGKKPFAFTDLFVVVDVKNEVAEIDKSNNTAIVARTDLQVAAK